jgi:PAT family beta-lactamase induction signal transducer AmpG
MAASQQLVTSNHQPNRMTAASRQPPSTSHQPPAAGRLPLRDKLFWITVLYFAEGFPFGIVFDNLPVYFRIHGVSLTEIGLMSLLGAPWTLKVLWSPLVDRFGRWQQWIVACLLTMALILYLLPFLPAAEPGVLLWAMLLLFTFASATQDIAIDGYSIRLIDSGEEGIANGFRVSAARVALIASGGGLVVLSAWLGWTGAFHVGAGLLVVLAIFAWRTPELPPVRAEAAQNWFQPLLHWLTQPGAPMVFLFVLTFKLADASMGPMVKPFWVDRGLSVEEIGTVSTTLGAIATILGALLGGAVVTRWGIFRGLWTLGLLQALSNLGYAAAAGLGAGRAGIYGASLCESFTGGLGTAAFLAFLMHICDKRRAATEYALLSALFGLTRSIAGAFSGWGAVQLGYAGYFALTFLLAFPAFALLPWVKPWADRQDERE